MSRKSEPRTVRWQALGRGPRHLNPAVALVLALSIGQDYGFGQAYRAELVFVSPEKAMSLLLGVGFGLGAVLIAFPSLHLVLKFAGGAYLLLAATLWPMLR